MKPAPCACGATYDEFKTGYTFAEVRRMLWVSSDDPEQWQNKSKAAVFRLWGQLKRDLWAAPHGYCQAIKRDLRPLRYIARDRKV